MEEYRGFDSTKPGALGVATKRIFITTGIIIILFSSLVLGGEFWKLGFKILALGSSKILG